MNINQLNWKIFEDPDIKNYQNVCTGERTENGLIETSIFTLINDQNRHFIVKITKTFGNMASFLFGCFNMAICNNYDVNVDNLSSICG